MCELDSLGNVQAVDTFGCNGLLARSAQTGGVFTSVLYAFDGYGNASQRLDTGGNVLETMLASAWGTLQSSNPSADPFRGWDAQDGVRLDSAGLYCLPDGGYYDPAVGATLSRAPGGSSGGNGYSLFGLDNRAPAATDSLFGLPENSLLVMPENSLLGLDSRQTRRSLSSPASSPPAIAKADSATVSAVPCVPLPSSLFALPSSVLAVQTPNPDNPVGNLEAAPTSERAFRWRGLCDDPNDPDDDGSTSYATSGMDAIRRGGGGRRGGAMARGFFNSVVDAIPGGGLIPALTGHDTFGCEMSGWSRVMSGVSGAMSLAAVVGHFGPLIAGPETEAAAGAAAGVAGAGGEFDKDLALGLATHGGRSPWGDMQAYLHLKNGAGTYYKFSSAENYAAEMARARSIHFNATGFNPAREGWTKTEWDHLLNNPSLHGKSTVYNLPPGLQVPPTIRVGPSFPPMPIPHR